VTDPTTPARSRGWWWLGLAVFAFALSTGLPVAQTVLPVHRPLMLLVPLLATCGVIGWWRGGSAALAVSWTVVAGWLLVSATRTGVNADALTAGWSAILAGCFGFALLAARSKRFLMVGVASVLSGLTVTAVLVAVTPAGPAILRKSVAAALAVRGNLDLTNWQAARAQMARSGSTAADSATTAILDGFEKNVAALPRLAGTVLPSVLALQSLAALAIAWALFHRFSRTRLGEDLSPLREFRFNDQWIWAVIVGLVLTLLPALASLRAVGINLLVFFGALYALRGTAVLAWFLRPGRSLLGVVIGVALLLLLRDGAAIALGLVGLGDTWADWRRRIRPAVS
jgi:Predicted membrane protein (DUF2232)